MDKLLKKDKIIERAKPYFYETGGDCLAILVHGFTGTPDDLKQLAKYLFEQGISVKVPLLAGHGRHWTALEDSSYYDWWKTVEDEVRQLSERYKNIYLVGYSFGANLSLDVAARYPDLVRGVVSMGASIFLRRELLIKIFLPFFHFVLKRYRKHYIKKEELYEYEDSGSYVYIPTKSIYDFYTFIRDFSKKSLYKIKVPALIIHSKGDALTHPLSSQYIYDRISSEKKELLILPGLNHNPLKSIRRDVIFGKIRDFIRTI